MNNSAVKKLFGNRGLKYGGYATLFTVIVLSVIIFINLIVQQIPAQFDFSRNELFSLSEQSKKILSSLDKPVTIYGMFKVGNEPSQLMEVIKLYENGSKNIRFKIVDPEANPGFTAKYAESKEEGLADGSLVVESGNLFKTIGYYDMLNVSYDDPNNPQIQSLAFEQRITNALIYVASGSTPKIYRVTGHREYSFSELDLQAQIENENYEVKDLNLLTEPSVPSDAELVALVSPKIDLSEPEAEKLRAYIENAGNVLFLLDFIPNEKFPVLGSLLQTYGIAYNNSEIAMEGDDTRYYSSQFGPNPFWIIPGLASHEITDPVSGDEMIMLVPESASLRPAELKRRDLEITPLLQTSDDSWSRKDLQSDSYERIASDTRGPVNLAYIISEKPTEADQKTFRLFVMGTSQFLSPKMNMSMIPGNLNFFMNALNWTADRSDAISVRAKSLFVLPMQLNAQQMVIFAALFTILIPLIVMIGGLVIWLRRRHL